LRKREERIANKALSTERAQNLMRTELEWMRRMPKARTTKAKYRIDAFYDLKKQSEYRRNDRQVDIGTTSARLGNKILILQDISKRFDDTVILDHFNYTFTKGEKLGIIGGNGVGKTTFLNIITGNLLPDHGGLDHGETVVYGYYRQQGIEFKPGQRVIDVLQEIAEVVNMGDGRQLSINQLLTKFLFPPEMQYVQVEKLSGGEKRRLYLMTVLIRNPNFLILDEPTNDFDLVTLNILEDYLADFGGCLIIVSHDRFFMDKIVDHLFIFEGDGAIFDFPGNYSDYRISQKQQEIEARRSETDVKSKDNDIAVKENILEIKRKLTYKEKQEYNALTLQIELLEKEKSELEAGLSSGVFNQEQLINGSKRIAEIISLLDEKSNRWFELSE
jgi:ATP-binding cassette subfamily F protein uup